MIKALAKMKKKGIFNDFRGGIREDILKYCKKQHIEENEFRQVSIYQWEDVYNKIVDEYVDKTKYYKQELHWLNISLCLCKGKEIQYAYDSRDDWDWVMKLSELVDNSGKPAYFLVEAGYKFWIFEGKLERISEIIHEGLFLEDYYIVDKKYQWMITYNHHQMIFFIGNGFRLENLKRLLPAHNV